MVLETVATVKRACLHCSGKLLADNLNALCGPCITRWYREHPRETLPQPHEAREYRGTGGTRRAPVFPAGETCIKGHVLQVMGYTSMGQCFTCGQTKRRQKHRPRIRYFFLPGLAKCMGSLSASGLSGICHVSAHSIREYQGKPQRAPEQAARVLAIALGVSLDELKWVS